MMLEQHVANYQLNIEPGTYHIYVVANMNKVLSGNTIQTEMISKYSTELCSWNRTGNAGFYKHPDDL